MRCSRCHAENPAGVKFCGRCAAPLDTICGSCGAVNPRQNRYCGQCAAPLDTARAPGFAGPAADAPLGSGPTIRPDPGEIKQVSVLFCDIAGSTALTERLGAEAMRDLVTRFLEISIAEVERYEGTVPQFTGDGFMAVFGAPRTQEDHVRRAVLAALGIRQALGGRSGVHERDRLQLPQIHIGIHTGPVVFGPIGANFSIETAIGDTANFAAHLQQAAGPGIILLSEATRLSAHSYARVEPVGPLAVKGRTEPVLAYRLIGVSLRRAARDGPMPERTTNFVDRTAEVATLQRLIEEAEGGRGHAVGIVGEPGIGKSRIIDEVRSRLGPGRVTWVEGRCLSYGTAIPYLLALDLLRSNCGIVETDAPDDISGKLRAALNEVGMDAEEQSPFLLHALGIKGIEEPALLSRPEAIKEKTFEILRLMAVNGSRRRPLVLVLEDLHWIDSLSHEFVGYLAESVPGAGILVLATHRPEYRAPWLGKSYAEQIALQPLSPGDSRHVVRSVSVLRDNTLADPVTEEIVAKGDGNPLFLEQLALHAGEAKGRRSELRVPATIHDVVMARIDRLPGEAKLLLQTAAVIGREFSLRLLGAVWPHRGGTEALLRELCRLDFLYERDEPEGTIYVFRHALTQEAAYGSLLERQRRASHAAIGSALEALYAGRTDEVAEVLALHFSRSDDNEKAVDYAIAAAEKSQRRWANNEALAYFDDALRRLGAMPDSAPNRQRRIDAVLNQAEVKYALGAYADHFRALEEIREIVAASEPRRRATWHYWTGFLHSLTEGRPEIAVDHCRRAAAIAAEAGLEDIAAVSGSCLTQVLLVAGELDDAVAAGERALASFELRGDLWWAGRTLWFLSITANYLGDWGSSLSYCRRALDYGVALDDLRLKAVSWSRMGAAYIQQGDIERGLECCDEALRLAPIPRDAAWARVVCGYGQIRTGQIDPGVATLTEALAWFANSQMRYTYLVGALWLAEGHLRRGDRPAALSLARDALETCRRAGYRHFEGRACWLVSDCLATEAPDQAEAYVRSAIGIFKRVGARNDLARAIATHARLRRAAGDVARARELLVAADTIFRALGTRDEPIRIAAELAQLPVV